jgi:citrate lyase beta subunit
VSITVVCARVSSGNRALNLPQRGAMADASNVRHDTIVVPKTMSPAQVTALAQRQAQAQVGDHDTVAFVHLPRITAGRR